jgi:23S rRNA pseudouridine1911/1915/1917 synthase
MEGVIVMPNVADYAKMLHVIFEDNHLLVVKKFIGVPSQLDESEDPDMVSIVREYIKVKYDKPGNVYLGLVHRLDRMVGGLMVFAKTSKAASRLSKMVSESGLEKKYYAVVNGKIAKNCPLTKVEDFLVKDESTRMSKVDEKKGKYSSLEYCSMGSFQHQGKPYSLLDINLETGRHHQIRVQMATRGYPIYGDVKYGPTVNQVGQTLALWAYQLSFQHPITQTKMSFKLSPEYSGIWNAVYDAGLLK